MEKSLSQEIRETEPENRLQAESIENINGSGQRQVQEAEWAEYIEKISVLLRLSSVDIRAYSPLTLAYIGDGVYDLAVRTVLVNRGNCKPHKLHLHCSRLVRASAQAKVLELFEKEGVLTEDEQAVCRRGRNAKPATMAKNATEADYKKATGFEALIGYLYLTGQIQRMLTLIRRSLDFLDPLAAGL